MKKLKKEVLIQEIFLLITQQCLKSTLNDTEKVYLSFNTIMKSLNEKYDTSYRSAVHLFNQIRSYEKENSLSLFDEHTKSGITVNLNNFIYFKQRVYLNKGLKVMLANGVLDLLYRLTERNKVLHIYLGSGTECYILAQIMFEKWKDTLHIYTHNLSIIQLYCEKESKYSNITLHTKAGTVDRVTLSLVEETVDYFLEVDFDAIIQSPRYIKNENCYVVSYVESALKKNIAKKSKGIKILLLTLFEFLVPLKQEENKLYRFSTIGEYDYIITPPNTVNPEIFSQYIAMLPLESYINYFLYNIYKVVRTPHKRNA